MTDSHTRLLCICSLFNKSRKKRIERKSIILSNRHLFVRHTDAYKAMEFSLTTIVEVEVQYKSSNAHFWLASADPSLLTMKSGLMTEKVSL